MRAAARLIMFTDPQPGRWLTLYTTDEDEGFIAYQCACSTFQVWPELWERLLERRKGKL